MDQHELRAWLRLGLVDGIGAQSARRLLAAFGSPMAVFEASLAALEQIVGTAAARQVQHRPDGLDALHERTSAWLAAAPGHSLVTLGDVAYPQRLLRIEDPPLMLYVQGPAAAADDVQAARLRIGALPALAMVGSRSPTPQGELNARQFAQSLARSGWLIVSGLAAGIDAAAHAGALDGGGLTVAVVGTGLDQVYPRRNAALAARIAQQGMVISEYPLGTPPLRPNFPRRNRLIAGLSDGTLVVEAAVGSGSLITARMASEQGREVFAIPGSIHSPQSRGCHALIRQGAKLVESAQDVLEELQAVSAATGVTGRSRPESADAAAAPLPMQPVPGPQAAVLAALGHDPASLDALLARTGLPTAGLQALLLELELAGEVARLPGGLYQRLGRS